MWVHTPSLNMRLLDSSCLVIAIRETTEETTQQHRGLVRLHTAVRLLRSYYDKVCIYFLRDDINLLA
jgi:hypothetical protein